MKKALLGLTAALALGFGPSAVMAADTFLFQWDDLGDSLFGDTYQNGTLIQHAGVGPEDYPGSYRLWNGATVGSGFAFNFNIYEANGALSDTWELSGTPGARNFLDAFHSDGGTGVTPLANATSLFETGSYQTVTDFFAGNGDHYILQFRSDIDVPEPSTWAMVIGGFGLIGLAARRRKLATASV